jgi:hypothetical protein
MFSETSGLTIATWCNIPEDIRHCYRRQDIPEDGVLRLINNQSTVTQLWIPITLKMEAICSPKRRV